MTPIPKHVRAVILLVVAGFASAACLVKETSNTLYLDGDGAVTWSILDRNVRSGDDDERTYFSAVQRDEHDVARGFRNLDARDVSTTILRAVRPYSVLTEARFAGLDLLGQVFLDRLRARGASTMVRNADGSVTWRLVVEGMFSEPSDDEVDNVAAVFAGDRVKVILTEGRFVAAEGFKFGGDEAVLIIDDDTDDEPDDDHEMFPLVISLTWTLRP
jgi:hypothetical protein